jgi:hypothetical protein
MVLKSLVAATVFAWAAFSSCSKTPAPQSAASRSVASSKIKDLGVLQLTNHYETSVTIGRGKNCRIVPKLLDRRDLQLTITLESKSADGKTADLTVMQIVGQPEKPLEVSADGTEFSFIPKIVAD